LLSAARASFCPGPQTISSQPQVPSLPALTLIRELSEKHDIPGYDHDLSDHEMQVFEEKLEDG
jgi:hypothetical protein